MTALCLSETWTLIEETNLETQ